MRKLLTIPLLFLSLDAQDFLDPSHFLQDESCIELYRTIKDSDCIKESYNFFKGANVKVGISLAKQSLKIEDVETETTLAQMEGDFIFAPFYSLATRKNFFDDSNFGYEFGLTYSSSYALNQSLNDGKATEDLGTYSAINMMAISPTLFYAYGARDETPKKYTAFGIGMGLGYAQVRGSAYVTENQDPATPCGTAVTAFEEGSRASIDAVRANCEQITYNESGFGASVRVILEGRWNALYASLDLNSVILAHDPAYKYSPSNTVVTFAYIIDINP
jgi:hypothetical protein